ncbi:hypothetical protein MtrunA17_Chr3g0109141 [Medicago truncatula]|uniref:Transmembrane protein n=1 Tax=Medicago truncatula TaxID=3880 RepID=A0A396IYI5_MEDTR|nr:hypothetical protein MtrunA17_Chr3g0109141 [Medicago truncatula]
MIEPKSIVHVICLFVGYEFGSQMVSLITAIIMHRRFMQLHFYVL